MACCVLAAWLVAGFLAGVRRVTGRPVPERTNAAVAWTPDRVATEDVR